MEFEVMALESAEPIDIAVACTALFDQYDDQESVLPADEYENLYPNIS